MRLAAHAMPSAPARPIEADPIVWWLVEQRGFASQPRRPFSVTTLSGLVAEDGRALLRDAETDSATAPVPGRSNFLADELYLRDDADPTAAAEAARAGAALLLRSIDAGVASFEPFRVALKAPVPHAEGSTELVLRRASGAYDRFVLPADGAPTAGAAVRDALDAYAAVVRQYYREFPA